MPFSFELTDSDFRKFAKLVYEKTGISLGPHKKSLLQSRISKTIRQRGLQSFSQYYNLLQSDNSEKEIIHFINQISTNTTHFFRENAHFEFIKNELFYTYFKNKDNIRIWCAASSTGEEPYSIAMTLLELFEDSKNIQILATDIDTNVLTKAKKGVFPIAKANDIPQYLLRKYFQKGKNNFAGYIRIKKEVRNLITFAKLNLIENFYHNEKFDIIFCRNVFIYFDNKTKEDIVNKMYDFILPGGFLFVGHSESLNHLNHPFDYIKPAIYQKKRLT